VKLQWAEPLVARVTAGLVRLLASTWRYRVAGWEHVRAARAAGRPIVYLLWHSRLLPLIHSRRGEGVALLISRHRDEPAGRGGGAARPDPLPAGGH